MKRNIKIGAFVVGLLTLFIILQYDFADDDSWSSWSLPLSGKIIYLDPGHGGVDPGAGDGPQFEKDIALNVSLRLRDYLQEQGALVVMTREDDKDLAKLETKGYSRRKVEDLKKRMELINESQADLFVSVHLNAIPSSKWHGAQTFYSPSYEENEALAKYIQAELTDNLGNTDRKAKAAQNIYILKYAKKPGVLVEIGFLSNPTEEKNLQTAKYQDQIAASIYEGIMRQYANE